MQIVSLPLRRRAAGPAGLDGGLGAGLGGCLAAGLLVASLLLAGCGSTVSQIPVLGMPGGLPPAPESPPATPSVSGRAPDAADRQKPMTPAERKALEADLRRAGTEGAAERRRRIHGTN